MTCPHPNSSGDWHVDTLQCVPGPSSHLHPHLQVVSQYLTLVFIAAISIMSLRFFLRSLRKVCIGALGSLERCL
jgi:hypothetical protein